MKRRGEVNIGMANYLYKNSNDIVKNINSNFHPEDINHIIIGRWYYGLFLISRYYLVNKCNYINNCNKKKSCKIYKKALKNNCGCKAKCLTHKGYHDKENNIHIKSIWEIVSSSLSPLTDSVSRNTLKVSGYELAKLREKYEYYDDVCSVNELQNAQNLFNQIKGVYKNEKII